MATSITESEALDILAREEGQFWEDKSAKAGGAKIQKLACALANADGGEFGVGIEDRKQGSGIDRWQGFSEEEDGNYIHQALVQEATPGVPYSIEWLQIEGQEARGLVAVTTVYKSASVHKTVADVTWVQMLEKYTADQLADEPELESFLESYSPATASKDFVGKQPQESGPGPTALH